MVVDLKENLGEGFDKAVKTDRVVDGVSLEQSLNSMQGKVNASVEKMKPGISMDFLKNQIPPEKLNKTILHKDKLLGMLKKNVTEGDMFEFLKVHGAYSLEDVAGKLLLDEKKLKKIWDVGIQQNIDPKFLLAILFAEGTGSFDTRVDKRGSYWNIDSDFDKDLLVTTNTINGYLSKDPKKNKDYYNISWQKNCPNEDPIVFIARGSCPGLAPSGGYASDANWPENIKNIYKMLGGYVLKDKNGKYVPPFYSEQVKYSFSPPYGD